jgi:hypothetical protein
MGLDEIRETGGNLVWEFIVYEAWVYSGFLHFAKMG